MALNEYEEAVLRFNKISRSHALIKEQLRNAEDWIEGEWKDAQDKLNACERMAGIPLDEYRRDGEAPCRYIRCDVLRRQDCGCSSCLMDLRDGERWTLPDVITEIARGDGGGV